MSPCFWDNGAPDVFGMDQAKEVVPFYLAQNKRFCYFCEANQTMSMQGFFQMDSDNQVPEQNGDNQVFQEIRALEEKYRIVADNTYDLERWVLPDKTLAYISHSCERITGYSPREFMEDREIFLKLIHPDDAGWFHELYRNSFFREEFKENVRYRIIRKDGQIRWLETTSVKVVDSAGNFAGYRTSSRDVTESVNVENELKISEQRYRCLLESQTEQIVRHLRDSTITYANEAFLKYIGCQSDDIVGKKWFDLVSGEVAEQVIQLMNMLTQETPSLKYEMMNKRWDGEERWFSWISNGIFDDSGELTELQVVGRDVTELKEAEHKLKHALEELQEIKYKLELENQYLREKTTVSKPMGGIVADSACMYEVFEKVKQVASTNAPVLLIGETGTGKELVAHAIHNASRRNKRTMVTVNCAALPPSLIESELFGREKGAYTGALSKQIGRFELANNSTLFLDEIGELPVEIQVKLLRVLQFGEYQLLGSPETRKVDVRIIAASNKNLSKAVADGSFRSDLFYRLNVFPIVIPPLRERKEDIPSLVFHFVDEIGLNMGKRIEKVSTGSMNKLLRHDWPGNVRELRNIIEYNMILSSDPTLEINLPDSSADSPSAGSLHDQEKTIIEKVLQQAGWRIRGKDGAAEKLGMKESTLRFKMKKLGLTRP